jgi:hypothetical protein
MLDLVTHENADRRSPAILAGGRLVTYGELAGMVGEVERLLRHAGKALVLCAGDRDLPTLLAYLAGLRAGHAVAFMPDTAEVLAAYRPEFVVPAPGGGDGLSEPGYTADPSGRIFRRRDGRSAGDIFERTAVLLATSGSTDSPKAVRLSYSGVAANTTPGWPETPAPDGNLYLRPEPCRHRPTRAGTGAGWPGGGAPSPRSPRARLWSGHRHDPGEHLRPGRNRTALPRAGRACATGSLRSDCGRRHRGGAAVPHRD